VVQRESETEGKRQREWERQRERECVWGGRKRQSERGIGMGFKTERHGECWGECERQFSQRQRLRQR